MATSSYRHLLRAVRDTFAGDAAALSTCRAEARKHFRANAAVADPARAARLVADALDAASFLRESVVQARLTGEGRYAMKVPAAAGQATQVTDGGKAATAAAAGAAGGGGGGCGTKCGCA